ncbi:MAG: hypothetical protein WAU61_10975 [Smithella sp.]
MKKLLFIVVISIVASSAYAADVGVSVSVGEPGFYGQINIGSAPQPEFISPNPVVIQPGPGRVIGEPLYLHVPPGHVKNWKKFCGRYNACGRPVYFVSDKWYNKVYVPHYRTHREEYRRGEHVGDKYDRDHDKKEEREHGDRHDR